MGHINKTPSGSFRANWRDPSGRQKAKTFPTKREASAFLAEIETTLSKGGYIDPGAAKTKFGPYATAWLAARTTEKTSAARDESYMRNHVLPKWADTPVGKVTYSTVQRWVSDLSATLAPASVAKCYQLTSAVLASAVRDRLIPTNPCEGVKLPSLRRTDLSDQVIPLADLRANLLPVVPARYQGLIALAAGAGLRWGELIGLYFDALDLEAATVSVIRTAIEVNGYVSAKPYPKSRAGRRTIPLPGWLVLALKVHVVDYPLGLHGEVFTTSTGGLISRGTFRTQVWRPSLVRAGLLGTITKTDDGTYSATWSDSNEIPYTARTESEQAAVALIAKSPTPGLRFHDLRHSYATELITRGVAVNEVSRVLGHGSVSTTLNRYTHIMPRMDDRVRNALDDLPLTQSAE